MKNIIVTIFLVIIFVLLFRITEKFRISCPNGIKWSGSWDDVPETNCKKLEYIPSITLPKYEVRCIQDIPRIIHQTHNKNKIPQNMKKAIDNIISLNPEYLHKYYDDEERRKIVGELGERTLRAYDSLIPGAYKSDLFRYSVLYLSGGVYIDTGFISLVPLSNIISSQDKFIAAVDIKEGNLYNAFICSVPRHPILKRTLEIVIDRIEKRDYGDDELYITGPSAFGKAFFDILKERPVNNFSGGGIIIGEHVNTSGCLSGVVKIKNKEVFYTKYPEYRIDSKWYCNQKAYGILWKEKEVFR